jgi:hypothetical protein
MKSKAIIFFSLLIFIFTIVIPGYRFIFKRSARDNKSSNKTVKLEEEIEEIRKTSSLSSLGIETYDPYSEYDKTFVANRKAAYKRQDQVKAYMDFSAKYSRATGGPANKLFVTAEKLISNGNFEKAADVLLAALKAEPSNDIMKLKIYQKLAMLFMINKNDKQALKALLRYVETCEMLDVDQSTKTEIQKVKLDLQRSLASTN